MDNTDLLKDLQTLAEKYTPTESPSICYDWIHKIKFTKAGELLLEKMFAEGKPMNCIPDCTVRICVSNKTVKVSVYHKDVEIGGFKKISTEYQFTIYDFCGIPIQLKMGPF